MRLKTVLVAASFTLVLGAVGCTKTESPKDVEASSATTAEATPDCPTQLVVDSVNEEFARITTVGDADVEGAFETMGEYIPSDLQEDFETWQSGALDVVDLLDGIDMTKDESELTESETTAVEQAQELMADPDLGEAQSNIKRYFRDSCPDIVWSEESESASSTETSETTETTASTEAASSGGGCPTADEIAQIHSLQNTMAPDQVIDDASIDAVLSVYGILDPYVPSDLEEELETAADGIERAFESVVGLTFGDISDPSTLSPEDQARVESFLVVVQDPETDAAGTAVDDYFTEACPELDL